MNDNGFKQFNDETQCLLDSVRRDVVLFKRRVREDTDFLVQELAEIKLRLDKLEQNNEPE